MDYDEVIGACTEFVSYFRKHSVLADEAIFAYMLSIDPNMEQKEPQREEVYALTRMFEAKINIGLPLSNIGDLVSHMRELESVEEEFAEFVESLDTSDREKRTLRSIVKKRRVGSLEMQVAEINIGIRAQLKKWDESSSGRDIAYVLLKHIRFMEGCKVEVEFTE